MQSDKQNSVDPVFIIGLALFGVQAFWAVINKLVPRWYDLDITTAVSSITSLIVPALCIYYVKDTKQRSILIILIFLLFFLRIFTRL